MKFLGVFIAAAALWGNELSGAGKVVLTICMNSGDANQHTFYAARAIASRILAEASVQSLWRIKEGVCLKSPDAILIKVSTNTPKRQEPGALAYALPFKGTGIEIFYDRILVNAQSLDFAPLLLGHVLAHEIVHLLQGIDDHSGFGLMKRVWTQDDHAMMRRRTLSLAKEDLDLIQRGLTKLTAGKMD